MLTIFNSTEAKCNETMLSTLAEDLDAVIHTNELTINITIIEKNEIRLAIDCQFHPFEERSLMFKQYEALHKRVTVMGNVVTDLAIKRNLVSAEKVRCRKRSKLQTLMRIICVLICHYKVINSTKILKTS